MHYGVKIVELIHYAELLRNEENVSKQNLILQQRQIKIKCDLNYIGHQKSVQETARNSKGLAGIFQLYCYNISNRM